MTKAQHRSMLVANRTKQAAIAIVLDAAAIYRGSGCDASAKAIETVAELLDKKLEIIALGNEQ